MKHTSQELKVHGFFGYDIIVFSGNPHLFVGIPHKELRDVLSAYDAIVCNGFDKPHVMFGGNYEGDSQYVPLWVDAEKTYCPVVMCRVKGFRGFADFMVHHSIIEHIYSLQDMRQVLVNIKEVQPLLDKLYRDAMKEYHDNVHLPVEKVDEPLLPQEQVEQIVYAPVGTVDLPVTRYDKREYSTDAKGTVVVDVLVGRNGIGLLQIMKALKAKGYDNKRYGDKGFKTLVEFNKVLKEEGLVDLVGNGFYQHVTDKGNDFGLHDLHFPKKNAWFWNLYDAKIVDILGDLWLDAGLMVQDGVYYKLIGVQEYYDVQGELPI